MPAARAGSRVTSAAVSRCRRSDSGSSSDSGMPESRFGASENRGDLMENRSLESEPVE